jgi:hypothetical protein
MKNIAQITGAGLIGVVVGLLGYPVLFPPPPVSGPIFHPSGAGGALPHHDLHNPCDADKKKCEIELKVAINSAEEKCTIDAPPPLHVHAKQRIRWLVPANAYQIKFADPHGIRIDNNVHDVANNKKFYDCTRESDTAFSCARQSGKNPAVSPEKPDRSNVLSYTIFLVWGANTIPCFVDPLIVSRG